MFGVSTNVENTGLWSMVYNLIRVMDGGELSGKVVPSVNEKVPGTLILSKKVAKPIGKATTTPKKRTPKV